ncbi:MAG: hypothetical protein QN131_09195 [Armatimonadota bacterium]|nr:hypothetical protein [Armatimonadota bacterium]
MAFVGQQADFADQRPGPHAVGAVEECQPLVVPRTIGEDGCPPLGKMRLDGAQAVQVLPHLLEGHQVEPGDHLGHQAVVGVAPVMRAQVGDVPGDHRQAGGWMEGDAAFLTVGPETPQFSVHRIVELELRFGELGHGWLAGSPKDLGTLRPSRPLQDAAAS